MRLYISRNILAVLVVSVALIGALGFLSFLFFSDFMEAARWGAHARSVLIHAEKVRALSYEVTTNSLRPAVGGVDSSGHSVTTKELMATIDVLKQLTTDNPSQQSRISRLDSIVLSAVSNDSLISAGSPLVMSAVNSSLDSIEREENQLITARSITASNRFRASAITIIVLVAVVLVLLVFLTITINTTLKKRAIVEEKLIDAEQRTQKINAELESFSYSVSHDLRSPLRLIDGYTKILKNDHGAVLNEDGNHVMEIVLRNVRRMGQLIDDLLDFSRVGRTELLRSTVEMGQLVKPIMTELLSAENGRKIEHTINLPVRVQIDPNLFRQVWINLLSNAIKYTRKNEHTSIEVGYTPQDGENVFFVKDNGVGFNMKYSDKLFSVFQRLHKESDFEGTGVGLALVKRIIERHDGRIWAESEVNKGTTFYFSLPTPFANL